jgi:hypothetical protein
VDLFSLKQYSVAIVTFTQRRPGRIYFAPAIIILMRAGNFYIEHDIQGAPVFFDSINFALRKMPLNPTTRRGLARHYRTTNAGTFFTRSHYFSPYADIAETYVDRCLDSNTPLLSGCRPVPSCIAVSMLSSFVLSYPVS